MKRVLVLFLLATAWCWGQPVPEDSRQMIVVTTPDWDSPAGQLRRFEKTAEGSWKQVGVQHSITVGRSGLGWGLGIHPKPKTNPQKREGDGRAPAGVFELTHIFGFPARKIPGGLPFLHLEDQECVDDAKSVHYNQIVDPEGKKRDWKSSEKMRIDLYRLGVVVAHNSDRKPGYGSCIFLHRWESPTTSTAGCTAMTAEDLEELAKWLQRDSHPVLVQLPKSQYESLKKNWKLPTLGG